MRSLTAGLLVPRKASAGGAGAPTDATYITQTAHGDLSAEQALASLATGIVKNTTTTGVLSIAAQGTDYYAPGGTDVAIADGGTGQSTATAAFDALAPTTSQGDILYHNGTDNVRLAKGTAGQLLKINSGATAPEWGSSKSVLLFGAGGASGHSPADATTYYWSASFGFDPSSTSDATAGINMPACTITEVYWTVSVFGSAGNSAALTFACVLRTNATTDSTAVNVTSGAGVNTGSNTALGFSISAGDRLYAKITTPTWLTTNPTGVFYGVSMVVSFP